MTLACCYGNDIGDSFPTDHRTSRKSHDCVACKRGIKKGEEYHITKWLYEGTIDTNKWCDKCYDMANALWSLGFCFEYDDLWGAYEEYLVEFVPKLELEGNEDRFDEDLVLHNGRTVQEQVDHVRLI